MSMIQLIRVSTMVPLSLWSYDPCFYDSPPVSMILWSMFLRWSTWAYDPTDPTDPCFCDGPPVPMIQLIHVSTIIAYDPNNPCFNDGPPVHMIQLIYVSTMVHLCLWSNWSMFQRWSTCAYDPTDPCFNDGPPVPMIQIIHVSTMVHLCLWSKYSMFQAVPILFNICISPCMASFHFQGDSNIVIPTVIFKKINLRIFLLMDKMCTVSCFFRNYTTVYFLCYLWSLELVWLTKFPSPKKKKNSTINWMNKTIRIYRTILIIIFDKYKYDF